MAEINDDLAQQMEQLRREMQGLDSATKGATTGLNAFGKATAAGAKELSKGLAGFAMQVGKGDTSFKSLNSVVDIASNALSGMAKAIPFAGEAVAAGLKAAAEGAKFMLEQMDQTTKAFTDLSKVGGLTATGMTGLQQQFLKSGLTLQTYTKVVGENSQALARMSGMVGKGADTLVSLTEHFTNLSGEGDDALRKLGLSSDDIAQTTGAFLTQQTRLGRSQQMTTEQLIAGTRAYALELDGLQKATGMSREAIMKQQDAALSESRFRASINSLSADQQKALLSLQTVMSNFGQELGQGTRDLVSGAANTEAAQKLMVDTGGAAADIVARLKAGSITATQAQEEMQKAIQQNLAMGEQVQQYVDGPMSNFANKADLAAAKFDESGNLIKKTQDAQINKTDDLTKTTVSAEKNMETLNREMNKLGFTFLPQAAKATEAVTSAMKKLVKFINDKVGGPGEEASVDGESYDALGNYQGGSAGGVVPAGKAAPLPANAGDVDKILATIRTRESGGDYGIKAKGSSASGAYQFIDSTWQAQAKKAGVGTEFKSAKEAPKEIQDAVARAYVQDILNQAGGDVSKVPLAWYTGNIQGKISPEALAANQGLTPEMYQSKWLKDFAKVGGGEKTSAANGAILSGPSGGYQPNLTMHGTEAVVPLDKPSAAVNAGLAPSQDIMMAQLAKLDEMVSVLKSQLSVNSKILAYQS